MGAEAGPRDWRGMFVGVCGFVLFLGDVGDPDCEMYSVAEVMERKNDV